MAFLFILMAPILVGFSLSLCNRYFLKTYTKVCLSDGSYQLVEFDVTRMRYIRWQSAVFSVDNG